MIRVPLQHGVQCRSQLIVVLPLLWRRDESGVRQRFGEGPDDLSPGSILHQVSQVGGEIPACRSTLEYGVPDAQLCNQGPDYLATGGKAGESLHVPSYCLRTLYQAYRPSRNRNLWGSTDTSCSAASTPTSSMGPTVHVGSGRIVEEPARRGRPSRSCRSSGHCSPEPPRRPWSPHLGCGLRSRRTARV